MNSQSPANNPQPSVEYLQGIPLFSGMQESALAEFAGLMKHRSFGTGLTLFHQDMPGGTLYLIESGYIRIYSIGQTGLEFTYYIYGPADIFGELSLLDNGYHSATCITLTPIKTWTIAKEDLLGMLKKYPSLSLEFLRLTAKRVRAATRKSEALAFQDVQGRLAYEILELERRSGTPTKEGSLINIPLNQIELASMVGATRESVNKALAAFKAQDLIRLNGTTITVISRGGLEKITRERGR